MLLVTGATGFVGRYILRELAHTNMEVRLFVRESSDISHIDRSRFELAFGSFENQQSLRQAFTGVKQLINLPNLIFGYVDAVIEEAQLAGVERSVFVGTTAMFTTLPARTKKFRLAAEAAIQASNLGATIIRPTMIYGDHTDGNISRLVRYVKRYPLIPIVGSGEWLQQPIHVEDLASLIVHALSQSVAIDKAYNVAGEQPLTYKQMIDFTAQALGTRIHKLYFPTGLILPVVRVYNKLVKRPLIKVEQIQRLNEHKAFDYAEATRDLQFAPRSFEQGIVQLVAEMRASGSI